MRGCLLAGRHAATWLVDTSTSVEFSSYKYPLTLSLHSQPHRAQPIDGPAISGSVSGGLSETNPGSCEGGMGGVSRGYGGAREGGGGIFN